jgi:hypothetical protein
VEADLDADRREVQDRIPLDDFVGPDLARTGVEVDPPYVLLDDYILPNGWGGDVVEFLGAAIFALGAQRDHFDNQDRF